MEIKKVTQVHFSPSGTTRKTAEALSESFGLPVDDADLLHDPSVTRRFGADKLVIFCLPVFAGRLPEFCPKLLSQFTGSDTPALAVVVYGNRDYEDALLELADLLKAGDLYWLAPRLWWHSTPSSRRSLPDAPMLPTSKSSTALPPQLLRRSVWLPGRRIWGNSPFPATIPTAS